MRFAPDSLLMFQHTAARRRLAREIGHQISQNQFQHTAARRRLVTRCDVAKDFYSVSTHSRPKAAGTGAVLSLMAISVSTHSRPKAAG